MKQNVTVKKIPHLTTMQCKEYVRLINLSSIYIVVQFIQGNIFILSIRIF